MAGRERVRRGGMPRKTALWKDVRRSISHSKGRFLSIVALMALGSFALVGLWVAGPDMRATGMAYFDTYQLADLTVISDYGLTADDQSAIDGASGTTAVEYGYFKDVTIDGTTSALRVLSEPDKVSQLELVEGRMPGAKGEIAVDSGLSGQYAIGDSIDVDEKPNELNDSTCLRDAQYKIVGYVNSPEIISIVNMGQSTAGTGSLKGYGVVVADEFDSEVYMTARLSYEDTTGLDPYSNDYRDRVQSHKEELEGLLDRRPEARLAEVRGEAQDKIDDGQAEVDDAKAQLADAKSRLDDARVQLEDAAAQLADGQAQIDDAQAQVDDGAAQIVSAQGQIDEAQATLDAAAREILDGDAQLAEKRAELDAAAARLRDAQTTLASARRQLDVAEAAIGQKQAELDAAKVQIAAYDDARAQIADAKEQIAAYDDGRQRVAEGRETIAQKTAEADAAEAELDAAEDRVEALRSALPYAQGALQVAQSACEAYEGRVADLEQQLEAETDPARRWLLEQRLAAARTLLTRAQATCDTTQAKVNEMAAAIKKYDDGREQLVAGRAEIAAKTAELDAAEAELDARAEEVEVARTEVTQREAELDELAPTVEAARTQVSEGEVALAAAREELAAKKAEYQQGVASYEAGRQSYEEGLAAWNAATAQLDAGRASYAEGAAALGSSRQTLAQKVDELASARSQVASARQTLAAKTAEYDDGLASYQDGLAEYEDALPDALQKISDGEADLADARARLAKLALPGYETDTRREALGSEAYKTYDTVSQIVDSLARVFPVLLYLVAAFVTLSTMTRMVEEERINSGTLKALGYHDGDVALKFVVYGSLAGGVGALLGIVAGHTLLPLIVYMAYGHAFTLPPIHLGFYPGVTLVAVLLAALCSVLPAVLAVRHELAEKPAQLLLPKPPKSGSKIFLERVGFLWRRLSFTHKVTARNLFRYKQRMLMTVLGVAGAVCMLVAGFGVQHSIQQMGERQFGQLIRYDMIVAQNPTATDAQLAEVDGLLTDARVAAHVPLHYETVTRVAGANADTQEITLLVPEDASSFDQYVDLEDRRTARPLSLEPDGAVISERLATLLGVGVGDEVDFRAADGSEHSVRVTGVAEMYMGHFMFMSREAFERCFGCDFANNAQLVRLEDGSLSSVEAASRDFMRLTAVKSVVQNTALEQQVNTVVNSLNMIMTVLIVVATALAVVIMYNLTNLNVSERMRELSTIKVLGFHSNETTMYIYRETILLTALGVLAGYALGVALHQYILNVVPPDSVMFNPELSAIEFWVPAVVIGVITVGLYFVELRRLSRVDMLEALKSVE